MPKRLIANFKLNPLLWVHDPGFPGRYGKHPAVKEVCAIHESDVFLVSLVISPALRVRVILVLIVPPHQRNCLDEICAGEGRAKPGVRIPRRGVPDAGAAAGHGLPFEALVVHRDEPVARHISTGVLVFLIFQLLQPVHRPRLEVAHDRAQLYVLTALYVGFCQHHEATEQYGILGQVPGPQDVRPQHDHRARPRLHLVDLRLVIIVHAELERAYVGARAN
mmetsp:Transcript_55786/g.157147  ORF Transcript_55786/g.157147 Transcript_55786/m.157147 type:complete len:221 (-) Transcript_55786:572-1234(-)